MDSKWDQRFLDVAKLVSTWSKDPSTQVGAAIAGPQKELISVGYNGFPRGMPDHEELYNNREWKYSRIVHGEMNALIHAKALPPGCTLYTYPVMSCDRCVVVMLQAGIRRFVTYKATPDKEERWGEAFKRTRQYTKELEGTLIEV